MPWARAPVSASCLAVCQLILRSPGRPSASTRSPAHDSTAADRSCSLERGRSLDQALADLDDLANGAELCARPQPHQVRPPPSARPRAPACGCCRCRRWTLSGSTPWRFPATRITSLVKHYQDGQLKRDRRNDPKLDAELALEVFRNQQEQAPRRPRHTWWLRGTGSPQPMVRRGSVWSSRPCAARLGRTLMPRRVTRSAPA